MNIEFDPAKDKLNVSNHGLSLKFAEQLVWDEAFVWVDPRYQYDELRRIISLRLAERRGEKICRKSVVSQRFSEERELFRL